MSLSPNGERYEKPHTVQVYPSLSSCTFALRNKCLLPDVVHWLICLRSYGQQDGLGSVLKKCCSVLSLAFLHPVAIDLERAGVDELADGLDGVRVALDHLLGDGLGAAVIAVDSHCGEHSHANDLMERVLDLVCISTHNVHVQSNQYQ